MWCCYACFYLSTEAVKAAMIAFIIGIGVDLPFRFILVVLMSCCKCVPKFHKVMTPDGTEINPSNLLNYR